MTTASDLRKIAEGREAEIYAWRDGTVLRLYRSDRAREDIEREAQAMRAAAAAGVRVPEVGGIEVVDGRPGLVMERIEGTDMLTIVGRKPWLVWSMAGKSGSLHAALHDAVAPASLEPHREMLRRHIAESPLVPPEVRDRALAALATLPDGENICHNDFHPGNVIHTDGEPVIIDWTNSTRGDPTADFVRTDLMIRMGDVPPGSPIVIRVGANFARGLMRQSYLRAYRRRRAIDRELASRWLLPVMANRLYENIESERPKLLRSLERMQGRV
jgi:uncharacterized protein (TIGR02172 family)